MATELGEGIIAVGLGIERLRAEVRALREALERVRDTTSDWKRVHPSPEVRDAAAAIHDVVARALAPEPAESA